MCLHEIYKRFKLTVYLWRTRLFALYSLATLSREEIESFYNSYILFDGDWSKENGKKESHIVDYYHVLAHLCSLGNVEKMYIPPLLDRNAGVIQNQLLYEQKMMKDIGLEPNGSQQGKKVLDMGCGRGRIALHVAEATGAFVCGLNLDPAQIASAQAHAKRIGLDKRTQFQVGSFNDPLPYADESFDAVYNVQAFSYSKDKDSLFREIYRILKPGAKFTCLEWVLLDNYDPKNSTHVEHITKTMAFIGAVDTIHYKKFEQAMTKAGFKILLSQDISIDGHQAPLIQSERAHYAWLRFFAKYFLASRFTKLLQRLKADAQHFVDADELRISTTSYQIICQKCPDERLTYE